MLVRRRRRLVPVPAPAVDGLVVVARPEVLVEDGPVGAVEGVLLPVGVAEVVDLERRQEEEESKNHVASSDRGGIIPPPSFLDPENIVPLPR